VARPDDAERLFLKGVHCGRSIVLTYGGALGLNETEVLDAASSISGEIGHGPGRCGAVEGACMLLAKAPPHAGVDRVQVFIDRFSIRFGSVDCETLLGHSMSTRADRAEVRSEGLIQERCPEFVRGTGEVVEEML
jgi:hypothetical protein